MLQQRPVRTSPQIVVSRAANAALAVGAALAAVSLAGPSAGRFTRGGHVVEVSTGTVDGVFAPALPRRARPVSERAAERGTRTGPGTTTPAPAPVAMTARQRVALDAQGTYIGDLLRARDSSVVRWPERVDRPLTVWIGNAAGGADWRPAYLARVADAFGDWTRTGVPVRFRFVRDSSAAEVHVAWTDRFREPISGRTVWSRDENWWMTDANITLALHHSDGTPLDEDQVRAIALHEIGHLLGLDHTSDPTSVMAARVRVRALSAADQATARLVYALPAGHL